MSCRVWYGCQGLIDGIICVFSFVCGRFEGCSGFLLSDQGRAVGQDGLKLQTLPLPILSWQPCKATHLRWWPKGPQNASHLVCDQLGHGRSHPISWEWGRQQSAVASIVWYGGDGSVQDRGCCGRGEWEGGLCHLCLSDCWSAKWGIASKAWTYCSLVRAHTLCWWGAVC